MPRQILSRPLHTVARLSIAPQHRQAPSLIQLRASLGQAAQGPTVPILIQRVPLVLRHQKRPFRASLGSIALVQSVRLVIHLDEYLRHRSKGSPTRQKPKHMPTGACDSTQMRPSLYQSNRYLRLTVEVRWRTNCRRVTTQSRHRLERGKTRSLLRLYNGLESRWWRLLDTCC